ncbi:hypothetical protein [Paracoccus salsus]|uniref:hypothetical protein n=1 Tax=Paracoccus salsus TaxID=2911061 RepID=UPI001F1FAFD8|nr:hypothetical protein [Paracoccus salsus]MCF3974435.1 hypothetical protein [Paracoccus salsus]
MTAIPALICLAACGGGGDTYPHLLPTEMILAEPALPDHAAGAAASPSITADETRTRAAALKRRADGMRGPVIEPDALARMTAARD